MKNKSKDEQQKRAADGIPSPMHARSVEIVSTQTGDEHNNQFNRISSLPEPYREFTDFELIILDDLSLADKQKISQMAKNLQRPANFANTLELSDNPEKCDKCLSSNPRAASKVLQTANSPLRYKSNKITNTFHAVMYLGTLTVKNIIIKDALSASFTAKTEVQADMYQRCWISALVASYLCKSLAPKFGIHDVSTVSNQALLNFMGQLTMLSSAPELADFYQENPGYFVRMRHEQDTYGFHSSLITSRLFTLWELPNGYLDSSIAQNDILLNEVTSEFNRVREFLLIYTCSRIGEYMLNNDIDDIFHVVLDDLPEADVYYLPYLLEKQNMSNIESLLRSDQIRKDVTFLIQSMHYEK